MSDRNQGRARRRARAFRPQVEGGAGGLEARVVLSTFVERGFVDTAIASGLDQPTSMAVAPDGHIFVAQKNGALRVIKDGQLLDAPALTVAVDNRGERGLGGVVVGPDFASDHAVYVYYTVPGATPNDPSHNRLSRFTLDGDTAVPGSERVLLDLDPLGGNYGFLHNGGAMRFGADGKLYLAVGDANQRDPAQRLDSLLGKVLRINPDGSIPADNPFVNQTTGVDRAIWATGLRNPFTMDIQPGTGRIYLNDVGSDKFEEINAGAPGANYGWPVVEGPAHDPRFSDPVYSYAHDASQPCFAITGGAFYNPATPTFPASYSGDYFFADLCGRWIKVLDPATGAVRPFASDLPEMIVDLVADAQGNLYYLTISMAGYNAKSQVREIRYLPDTPPVVSRAVPSVRATAGAAVTFSADADGDAPLTYQWQRNEQDIPGATGATYTLPAASAADDGARFRAVVTNPHGSTAGDTTALTVVADQPPRPVINLPDPSLVWKPGDTIAFSGGATDPEDGVIPPSGLTWWVELHHNDHTHPMYGPTNGIASGSFQVPNEDLGEGHLFLRVHLRATDAQGLSTEVTRDLIPAATTPAVPALPVGEVRGGLTSGPGAGTLNGTTTTSNRPRFSGVAPPDARIVLTAVRESDGASVVLGTARASRAGRWSLTARTLAPGSYRVLVSYSPSAPRGAAPPPADPPKSLWDWALGPLVARPSVRMARGRRGGVS